MAPTFSPNWSRSVSIAKTFISALVVSLTACGGGGGSSSGSGSTNSTAPSVPDMSGPADGFWTGRNDIGYNLGGVFLDSGDYYGVTTDSRGALFSISNAKSSGTGVQFKMTGNEYSMLKWGVTYSTASGTLNSKSSLLLTTSGGTTISARYDASYDTPAAISQIAGSYSASGISARGAVGSKLLTISSSGAMVFDYQNGCIATGSVSPRSNNVRRVFNISMNFSGNTCVLGPGAVTTGVLYVDSNVSPSVTRILTLTSSGTDAFVSEAKKL